MEFVAAARCRWRRRVGKSTKSELKQLQMERKHFFKLWRRCPMVHEEGRPPSTSRGFSHHSTLTFEYPKWRRQSKGGKEEEERGKKGKQEINGPQDHRREVPNWTSGSICHPSWVRERECSPGCWWPLVRCLVRELNDPCQ